MSFDDEKWRHCVNEHKRIEQVGSDAKVGRERMSQKEAGKILHLGTRQIKRLLKDTENTAQQLV